MSFTKSLSMIVPAVHQDKCNRLMRALGRDNAPDPGKTFSVELSPTGQGAVTHYGAHGFDDDLVDILDGSLPSDIEWTDFGLTAGEATQAHAVIFYLAVVNNNKPLVNFYQRLTNSGLTIQSNL